jgi:hypothetical protein
VPNSSENEICTKTLRRYKLPSHTTGVYEYLLLMVTYCYLSTILCHAQLINKHVEKRGKSVGSTELEHFK